MILHLRFDFRMMKIAFGVTDVANLPVVFFFACVVISVMFQLSHARMSGTTRFHSLDKKILKNVCTTGFQYTIQNNDYCFHYK